MRRATRRALGSLAAVVLAACAGPPPQPVMTHDGVVVASFDFPESVLLAEVYAGALEHVGVRVRREFELGPRELVRPALEQGLVDVVPEYLGSAVEAYGSKTPPRAETPALQALRRILRPRGLVVLMPARAEDRDVLAVTPARAAAGRLRTVSDLARERGVRFTAPPECARRPLCLPGIRRVYRMRITRFIPLITATQRLQAIDEGVADVALLFSTDPALSSADAVVLVDDRHLEPPQNVVPVVTAGALRFPRVAPALDAVSRHLTTPALATMVWRVTTGGRDARAEARAWLRRNELG